MMMQPKFIKDEIPLGTVVWYHPIEGEPYKVKIRASRYYSTRDQHIVDFFAWTRVSNGKDACGKGRFTKVEQA